MDAEPIRQLKESLELVALPVDQGGCGGWIPGECMEAFHKLTVTPFYELVLHRKRGGVDEFLVVYRKDKWWDGFHCPGSMLKPGHPADPAGIAQVLVDSEFPGLGLLVTEVRIVAPHKWPWHPWCHPNVSVLLIEFEGVVPDSPDFLWATSSTLPENMVINHGMYVRQCEQMLLQGTPLVFTGEHPYGV